MDKLGIKKEYKVVFPICEYSKKDFIRKIVSVNKISKCALELRLDYLLSTGMSIEEIVKLIHYIREKCTNKKLIATIRTINQGGKVDLPKEKYFYFIKELYLNSNVHAIDIEYKYYNIDKVYYDSLFKKKKKDVILSIHFFDKIFNELEYVDLFKEMIDSKADIVKIAIKTFTKEDLFMYLNLARKSLNLFKENKKLPIIIAMGELGKISRIIPEYTGTRLVFLTAYDNAESEALGQVNIADFKSYRKILEKRLKN